MPLKNVSGQIYKVTIRTFGSSLVEPDFSCLEDEIAKPRPDMNIKVAAITVSEQSIKTKYRYYVTGRWVGA